MFRTQGVTSALPPNHKEDPSGLAQARSGSLSESTIHYIEEAINRGASVDSLSANDTYDDAARRTSPPLNGLAAAAVPSLGMYVRALYDYEADDRTSLSFRRGDIIQVITQLESGWWDGFINGVRGWFPSNYCALVPGPAEDGPAGGELADAEAELDDDDDDSEDAYEYDDLDSDGNPRDPPSPGLPMEGTENSELEEAAFWVPQATPDGRLFYFNTQTGVATMELPLETPTSATETGPPDRMNVSIPENTRPPLEMMVGGYERDEDTMDEDELNSASEREGEPVMATEPRYAQAVRKKGSNLSYGISPATSIDSMGMSPMARGRDDHSDLYHPDLNLSGLHGATAMPSAGTTSFTNNPLGQNAPAALPRSFFDDGTAVPLTWNRLVENMRLAVERYRQAISNSDRSDFVKRAEDISDHLRLLLAAGSGTTDNHSGQPSIISTNKALYPHFRDMMSKFSKLVLSSHIAAADWPTPDSYAKCLQEADGVLHGVYGYVEIARQQRGEEIQRLVPGFVIGSNAGGNWQNNGLRERDPTLSNFMDQDDGDPSMVPTARLDGALLERLEDLKRMITASIRRLDEQLMVTDKIVTAQRHEMIGDSVCAAGAKVIEIYRPFLSAVESLNLGPLGSSFPSQALTDYGVQKQKLYDLVADLLTGCQAVASPLADEWAETRGESLEDRMHMVRSISRQLETCTSQLFYTLQLLDQMMPREDQPATSRPTTAASTPDERHDEQYQHSSPRRTFQRPPEVAEFAQPQNFRDNSKLKKFFGEEPNPMTAARSRDSDDVPDFLRLDLENEISFDYKTEPPQLRGGTLAALVEQLTRHDRHDSSFNNTFLLTYRSFTTAAELFDMLVARFSIQPPYGLGQEDYQTWVERKQKLIRFRVVNILKSWFDNYWMEGQDAASKDLLRRVYSFAERSVATTNTPGAQQLMAVLEQRLRGQDTHAKKLVATQPTAPLAPILPKNMKKLKFLDIDVTEFARQLTIIESKLYGKIKPTECLNKTWQKKVAPGEPEPAPNVKALILHSNQLTNWVAEMILTQTDLKKRVVVIKHFVSVADKCRALNNFSTLTSIISALSTAPIHRLGRTWHQVHTRTQSTLEQMRSLMASTKNFAEYRETLHLANPPCIPFFGVYLTDLTFIEDGIPGTIKKTNLINFHKRAKTAEIIRDIQQCQNEPYPLQPVPELQDYILTNMQSAGDVHEMYDRSLAVEPRENQDEKIARYGFKSGVALAFLPTGSGQPLQNG
ncbi:MAG: hypothetical protein M1832_001911 [Thelocarpon impressellum]|nr:MAG: hypothetical protein M1832_001911 [Thelocarpon impressellum]